MNRRAFFSRLSVVAAAVVVTPNASQHIVPLSEGGADVMQNIRRTRLWIEGGSLTTTPPVIGATTIPVNDATWYIVGGNPPRPHPSGQPQRITYTGLR